MTVRIIGIGNVLMSDDGFGPSVARILGARYRFPAGVEIIDAGTPGLDLTPYLLDVRTALVVDTVTAAAPPGSLHTFWLADILGTSVPLRLGPHDPGLKNALLTVAAAGRGPRDVLLIGAVPERVEPGVLLSVPVSQSIELVIRRIVDELQSRGVAPVPRPRPFVVDTWWNPGAFSDPTDASR